MGNLDPMGCVRNPRSNALSLAVVDRQEHSTYNMPRAEGSSAVVNPFEDESVGLLLRI
jgi:hypothetical protein